VWAFWIACGLAAVGGISPLLLGGGSNRIYGVILPFAVAAIAFGASAVLYRQGKALITAVYFLASLAIVYGILALIAVPLRLAVVGTCPPGPAPCAAGLEHAMTGAEDTALTFAIGIGIVAIFTGFFALVILYRRQPAIPPPSPPVRSIPSAATSAPVETTAPPAPASTPEIASKPEPVVAEPELDELPPPKEELELPAPTEALELPAPADSAATHEDAPPAPAMRRNPRRRRASRAPTESPPAPNIDA
jgi:hypothetical protein